MSELVGRFRYLDRHLDLLEDVVEGRFFRGQRTRAMIEVALYAAAGVLGYLIAPAVALAIFLTLPAFYGITSEGLYELTAVVGRPRPQRR